MDFLTRSTASSEHHAQHAIITLDPNSLAVTNHYDLATDFEGVTVGGGRDDAQEFAVNVRVDGRGKFKPISFTCPYRAALLTELFRVLEALPEGPKIPPPANFQALHLRRRLGDWVPQVRHALKP
eukprot:jgi/Mesen1/7923/ME000422S07084